MRYGCFDIDMFCPNPIVLELTTFYLIQFWSLTLYLSFFALQLNIKQESSVPRYLVD